MRSLGKSLPNWKRLPPCVASSCASRPSMTGTAASWPTVATFGARSPTSSPTPLEHTPPEGHVTLAVGRNGTTAIVRVIDDGFGVSEKTRAHLFTRFARGDDRRGGGSGLGLYIVRRVAEESGGTRDYEPNQPQGSVFTLALSGGERWRTDRPSSWSRIMPSPAPDCGPHSKRAAKSASLPRRATASAPRRSILRERPGRGDHRHRPARPRRHRAHAGDQGRLPRNARRDSDDARTRRRGAGRAVGRRGRLLREVVRHVDRDRCGAHRRRRRRVFRSAHRARRAAPAGRAGSARPTPIRR